MASLRPASSAGSRTKPSWTPSLQTALPGATVTLALPPKVTGRLVPLTRTGPPICKPTEDVVERDGLGAEHATEAGFRCLRLIGASPENARACISTPQRSQPGLAPAARRVSVSKMAFA